jgi:hypothetical protein
MELGPDAGRGVDEDQAERDVAMLGPDELVRVLGVVEIVERDDLAVGLGHRPVQTRRDRAIASAKPRTTTATTIPIPSPVAIAESAATDDAAARAGPIDAWTSGGTTNPAARAGAVAAGTKVGGGVAVGVAADPGDGAARGLAVEGAPGAARAVAFGVAGVTVALEAVPGMPWIETHRPSQAIRIRA